MNRDTTLINNLTEDLEAGARKVRRIFQSNHLRIADTREADERTARKIIGNLTATLDKLVVACAAPPENEPHD